MQKIKSLSLWYIRYFPVFSLGVLAIITTAVKFRLLTTSNELLFKSVGHFAGYGLLNVGLISLALCYGIGWCKQQKMAAWTLFLSPLWSITYLNTGISWGLYINSLLWIVFVVVLLITIYKLNYKAKVRRGRGKSPFEGIRELAEQLKAEK